MDEARREGVPSIYSDVVPSSIVQLTKDFHVFVDASDITIGSVLMQLTVPRWYCLVYYASRKLSKAERNYSTTEREKPSEWNITSQSTDTIC